MIDLGEGRVGLQLTLDEMEEIAFATSSFELKRRLVIAIALLDRKRADRLQAELSEYTIT